MLECCSGGEIEREEINDLFVFCIVKHKILQHAWYQQETQVVARGLLGKVVVSELGTDRRHCVITQTEAYLGEHDLASHARFGKTARSWVMYERGGV